MRVCACVRACVCVQLYERVGPYCPAMLPSHPAGRAAGPGSHHRDHRVPLRPPERHIQVLTEAPTPAPPVL